MRAHAVAGASPPSPASCISVAISHADAMCTAPQREALCLQRASRPAHFNVRKVGQYGFTAAWSAWLHSSGARSYHLSGPLLPRWTSALPTPLFCRYSAAAFRYCAAIVPLPFAIVPLPFAPPPAPAAAARSQARASAPRGRPPGYRVRVRVGVRVRVR
eukprot:scaffold21462_cov64-Phaeocystis_antarctica.AAC.1